nr:MAG TPA: hypothetical protein [Caudoviricetes sp.]
MFVSHCNHSFLIYSNKLCITYYAFYLCIKKAP